MPISSRCCSKAAAIDVAGERDRLVERAQAARRSRPPRSGVREPHEEVRHLHRGQAGLAGQRDRALGGTYGRGEVAQALLEVGLQVVEVRPVHPPRRRHARLEQRHPRLRLGERAPGHQRRRLGVVDLEQVGGEPVALGDRPRLADTACERS